MEIGCLTLNLNHITYEISLLNFDQSSAKILLSRFGFETIQVKSIWFRQNKYSILGSGHFCVSGQVEFVSLHMRVILGSDRFKLRSVQLGSIWIQITLCLGLFRFKLF